MTYDPLKLDAFLKANFPNELRPNGDIRIFNAGDGVASITSWPKRLGDPPTPSQVNAFDAASQAKLDQSKAFLDSREVAAKDKILTLKVQTAGLLVAGGMSESEAMATGSRFVLSHAAVIQAFILAGGNPVAGQALLDSVLASPPTWWSPAIEALFEGLLL